MKQRRKPLAKQQQQKERYRFTKQDCQRGYRAALAKCMEDWALYAWFFHRIRGHYRHKEEKP
ncbi:MAG: hypothetical protein U0793_11145 [Gemmataceae bacterium]